VDCSGLICKIGPWLNPTCYTPSEKRRYLRAAIFARLNSFKRVFLKKYGKIQRIFPAVDVEKQQADPPPVLLANGASNGLIFDHLFYQAPPTERFVSTA
jgi:hypothetical protein